MDNARLTWIEYKLETFAELLKIRLAKIVQPKETVSDWDKATWFTSIVVLLGNILPPNRFIFRIIEEESKFIIQLHDPAQQQEPKDIEVPYRKVFDWGVESWSDALQLRREDRCKLYTKWTNEGFNDSQIARHFGLGSSNCVHSWAINDSLNSAIARSRKRFSETTTGPVIARVRQILKENGVDSIIRDDFIDAYYQTTGSKITCVSLVSTQIRTLSPDIQKCLNIAIQYVGGIVEKIKEMNSSTRTSRSIGQFVNGLRRSSWINVAPKKAYDPVSRKMKSVINRDGLEKILNFYINVLNNLNKKKGELEK